jgi:putative FmdB family regulatory protein
MPIYAYRCSSCDCQKDVMQKMSDAPLSTCPECGKETFSKQLTAAGFQLKGNGYYVTDFKGGAQKPDAGKPDAKSEAKLGAALASAPTASTASSGCPAKSFSAPVTSGTA